MCYLSKNFYIIIRKIFNICCYIGMKHITFNFNVYIPSRQPKNLNFIVAVKVCPAI